MSRHGNAKRHAARTYKSLAVVCAICALVLAAATSARSATNTYVSRPVAPAAQNATASSAQVYANVVSAAAEGDGVPFAIADFDGDQLPDLARVQSGPGNSYQTQYWIQLQLTHAGRQLIGVLGPAGGLQLTASDVNGDHAIDLVLRTAWLNRPVAILLNDGHGRFRAERPGAFPGAFRRASANWLSHTGQPSGAAGTTQSCRGIFADTNSAHAPPRNRAAWHSSLTKSLPHFLLSRFGRAPPLRS